MSLDAVGISNELGKDGGFEAKVLIGSELVIALCYFVIPSLMFWYMKGIEVADVFLTVRIWFMLFIVCCGLTHFLGFLSFWWKVSWVVTLGKLVTAIVSVGTIIVLLQYMVDLDKLMRKAAQLEKDVDASIRQLKSLKLRNEELARLKEEALRIANMRQEFISTVSHEVRTPLQSIIGFGEILEQSELDPSQQQMLRTMLESSRMLCTIINDILDFSKYQKDNFTLEEEPFSIVGAIVSALRISSSRATAKGIDLRYQICNRVSGILRGDLTRVVQVLSNLISNGVKFTDKGHVSVLVRSVATAQEKEEWIREFDARPDTYSLIDDGNEDQVADFARPESPESPTTHFSISIEPNESTKLLNGATPSNAAAGPAHNVYVDCDGLVLTESASKTPDADRTEASWGIMIQIADTGVGVPARSFSRIFRRFMQSDTSTTRMFGGTGLGLSIVQQLTTCMKGSIHLESTVGKGSIFTIFLKLPSQAESPVLLPMPEPEVLPPPSISPRAHSVVGEKVSLSDIAKIGAHNQSEEAKEHDIGARNPLPVPSRAKSKDVQDKKRLPVPVGASARPSSVIDGAMSEPGAVSRVLLVDDNEINRAVTKPMLHRAGVPDVEVASDGQQAYEKIMNATKPYDAILMDLHMPVLDGFGATQKIRLNLRAADRVPIFAFTAASFSIQESKELREKGFSGIVFKPCTIARIKSAMDLAAQFRRNKLSPEEFFTATEAVYTQRN